MGEWLKNNPIGSQAINLAITIFFVLIGIVYMRMQYSDITTIATDTNKRIINIEKHIVPDSLEYFAKDTIRNGRNR